MSQFLFYYQRPEPATWVYMSSFVIIALYFMFHRLWSIRNLDILLVILLTPGLMLVYEGRKATALEKVAASVVNDSTQTSGPPSSDLVVKKETVAKPEMELSEDLPTAGWTGTALQFFGFAWLLGICAVWIVRLLLDTAMVRRPLLEPNLSSGGTTFIGVSLFVFLMANVVTSPPLFASRANVRPGPGYDLLKLLPAIQTSPNPALALDSSTIIPSDPIDLTKAPLTMSDQRAIGLSRLLLIASNLVLVLGIVSIGYWHFENLKTGIGIATLFLLLPYTAQMTGRLDHLAPGALIVMAVAFYRQPLIAGFMLGAAAGLVFFPFFLLPLWTSFYWLRGRRRFLIGVGVSLTSMVAGLTLVTNEGFWFRLRNMFGAIRFATDNLDGIWGLGWHPYFRIPVMVIFVLLSLSFVLWPAQKSLATLLSCSAAIMAAAQFCYAYGGGLYMAWFLPCLLLTVFRPNLDDCIALDMVRSYSKSKSSLKSSTPETASNYAEAG
jgi:hypothetical protein